MMKKYRSFLKNKFFFFKKKKHFFDLTINFSNGEKVVFSNKRLNIFLFEDKNYFSLKKNIFSSFSNCIIKIIDQNKSIKNIYFLVEKIIFSSDNKEANLIILGKEKELLYFDKNKKIKQELLKEYKEIKVNYKYFLSKTKLGLELEELYDSKNVFTKYQELKMMKGLKLYYKKND
ncbi:hypothetical protein NX772_01665 [Mesomycoplasma molare]|uniref:Uncharacterized protein n=2 Tax=Mesomycoplasma molare TaxID=171288 RepID=A0ABY5TV28_9BACT|nr:hypothetical protein [Mesomycoplasma molare]UWD34519.1 hypothetical protein NX772_01665 [Mesomycoplasma molare]